MNKYLTTDFRMIFKCTWLAFMAALLCAHASAQNAPPEMDIGTPPDFIPPPPPPNFTPPSRAGENVPLRTFTDPPVVEVDEAALLQRQSLLVNENDPMMQETVGLIRIPEMGTNEVLEMLENFTAKPILRQQSLPTVRITFFSQGPLSRGEAITAIESLLSLNGIAITTLGDKFLKAVPAAVLNAQVARIWEGTTLNATPSQMMYEKLFELDFLNANEAAAMILPLMSQGAPIAFDKSGFLLITDALINLQRIERLLPILDQPGKMRSEILFFKLQNIEADEVVRRLQQLVSGALRNQLENNTTFEADERTNQLIVFTHPANAELVKSLIEKLDIDVAPTTATKVYSIRYADATEVVAIIDQVVSGQREIRNEAGQDSNAAARAQAAQAAAQIRQNNQTVAAARADASNLQFSNFFTIVPDERANTIVASGTNSDLIYLEQLIDQIDTLLAQVRIEVVITEVRLGETDTRGIDNFGFAISSDGFFDFDFDGEQTDWSATPGDFYGAAISPLSWKGGGILRDSDGVPILDDNNETISIGAGTTGIGIVLNAAQQNSDITVLSAPTIVTTHNKEASVSVGEERPVITSTTRDLSSSSNSNFVSQDQVQYRDIKLELKVTPLIGSDGVVQMEIEQEVQSVIGEISVNDNPQPIVGTRSATSYVSVKDKELIVLGGLQSLDTSVSKGRMALLGRIPILGNLFTSEDTQTIRNELLIFIRPTIIRTTDDAHTDAVNQIDVLEGANKIQDYLDRGTFREPEPEPIEKSDKPYRDFSTR